MDSIRKKGMLEMHKRICIIGHFGMGQNLLNGQTIKTKNFTAELEKIVGKENVHIIDTHGGIKNLISLPFRILFALSKCQNIVFFPAQNGLRIIAPLLVMENLFFSRKLHYVVIGGWLPEFVRNKALLKHALKNLHGIYVETKTMKKALFKLGFENLIVMPNFKNLSILKKNELSFEPIHPYKLCTFSRVMKKKGIEDAIDAVVKVNDASGRILYSLDIYGQIDPNEIEWFNQLKSRFPDYINYCGSIDSSKSVDILKEYFLLLFPTRFFTEGIPGTIIDAYASGIPIIASRWESFSDIVDEGKTGFGYDFGNTDELCDILCKIEKEPNTVLEMKTHCLDKALNYLPEDVMRIIINRM